MKTIILAAGQGTRLRPLTDDRPKCMVEVNGKSIIRRQLDVMLECGIKSEDITIVGGYRVDALREELSGTGITIIFNEDFETTNMVCSLMCARDVMKEDILISYGDIIYNKEVLNTILSCNAEAGVIVDDGWESYWRKRNDNPLDDAETLMFDGDDNLTEIGQKTTDINRVMSQYIGLMRFRGDGLKGMLATADEAKKRSDEGVSLWRTDRKYNKMYMTDLLQGMIDEGYKLKAMHINRGWFEVDDVSDLKLAESELA
ncbi:phosphocholine cytidylyltransferase family protein [Butyrivibrio sp. TB]|uniref:phosphocholine cytidylyltransferase family protein n=1 Tax=Butyrivibrio sp. TB TaxID=1520809 RepID=UPI0008D5D46C|nr:phosphocholine cytidylyltransferase family protein [Butyrivibrio sp. TB]SEQ14999.1 Choline kinase [Butyrivibrio sp. TB]